MPERRCTAKHSISSSGMSNISPNKNVIRLAKYLHCAGFLWRKERGMSENNLTKKSKNRCEYNIVGNDNWITARWNISRHN